MAFLSTFYFLCLFLVHGRALIVSFDSISRAWNELCSHVDDHQYIVKTVSRITDVRVREEVPARNVIVKLSTYAFQPGNHDIRLFLRVELVEGFNRFLLRFVEFENFTSSVLLWFFKLGF